MFFQEVLTDELVWEDRLEGNDEGAKGGLWRRTFVAEKTVKVKAVDYAWCI